MYIYIYIVKKGIKKAGNQDIPPTAREEILELATRVDDRNRSINRSVRRI